MKISIIPRVFVIKVNGKTTELADPNPVFSIDDIRDLYSNQYPELINCETINKGLVGDRIEIEFKTIAGTKG